MDSQCIPANPDISGIGVCAAIYAQNLFCFAPVITNLWDGEISGAELEGVKDQSVGMLAIAFAILISTIVEATSTNIGGQGLTKFHAAIILDLSWMNNTSTWIWFLLYVHQRTKPAEKSKEDAILASWSAWTDVLLSPVRFLISDRSEAGDKDVSGGDHVMAGEGTLRTRVIFVRRAWIFATKKPVLTIGFLHLSLMAAIGFWLWSNPSKFGSTIPDCNLSLSIFGGAMPFSSPGLRIFSLTIYCLLIMPGLNLVLPFLFFLVLHITYNEYQPRLARFIHLIRTTPSSLSNLFRRCHMKNHDLESGTQLEGTPGPILAQTPYMARTAFLTVGLVCLLIINLILLVDVELTLRRNKHKQSTGENDWGFGQVLALLLLVVPIQAIAHNTFVGHDFQGLIEQGADPKVELDGAGPILSLLHFAASKGNNDLVQFLLDKGVKDTEGCAFHAAAQNKHHKIVGTLGEDRSQGNRTGGVAHLRPVLRGLEKSCQDTGSESSKVALEWLSGVLAQAKFRNQFRSAIHMVVEVLSGSNRTPVVPAINCVESLGAHAELRPEIRPAIPILVELRKDNDWRIRKASIQCLSSLGAHTVLQKDIGRVIPRIVESLRDDDPDVRQASIKCLSSLGTHAALKPCIREVIPTVKELMKDRNWAARQASIECLSSRGKDTALRPEIRQAIPILVELRKDDDWRIRKTSIQCLSSLGVHTELQPYIQPKIPMVVESLKDPNFEVCLASIDCLSGFGAHTELQLHIQPAIPILGELLKNNNLRIHKASIQCLSSLGAHTVLQPDIGAVIPMVVESLRHEDSDVRQASIQCLSSLGAHMQLQSAVQPAIPMVVELLKDDLQFIRMCSIQCLSNLGAHIALRPDINQAIPIVKELLKDHNSRNWNFHQAAAKLLEVLESK
ncbi:Multiple ankyrin repeats single kh domain [Mycena sanguinolenta]|uniref:Multiple ankyrin repeats single kh domain n=1 Tax=Mycena sanguinolenta TaxID=230812 RepID=A0A8H6YEP1_9AGAR|nr:Multiple ankyrin repeats single kh domain [Mycena sanguinolenta]